MINDKIVVPSVLACGYKSIQIQKTHNRFPAFFIALPNQSVWRSKRDFLLLARSNTQVLLPKAALKKLAETGPWKRPKVGDGPAPNAPNHFHARMKKSLLQLDQFLQEIKNSSDTTVQEAWECFCRPGDTEGLVDDNETQSTIKTDGGRTITSQQRSSQLGQYFCSKENAKRVVNWVMKKIQPSLNQENILFLEPSCGFGDIVMELTNQLALSNVVPETIAIRGYDIDSNAIRICKELPESKFHTVYTSQNFLETKSAYHHTCCIPPLVVCLGGPPYTTGAGSSSDIRRDLPTQFIDHCLNEYRASIICFLLPVRYRDCKMTVPDGFQEETLELKSSTFYFQGETPVTQPSIIKCLHSA